MRNLVGKSLATATVLACLFGVVLVRAQEAPAEETRGSPKPLSVYRVEFAIHESEDGKRVNTRNYAQVVEEGGHCRVRAGSRVPITTGAGVVQYMDVGVRVDCELSERDGYVRLDLVLEITSFAQDQQAQGHPLLRNIRSELQTAVQPDKPTVVSSIDDTTSQRRYELAVTATKVK